MENLDEQTQKTIEALKQSITNATERLNSIDLQKALDDHEAMEKLKETIGVK